MRVEVSKLEYHGEFTLSLPQDFKFLKVGMIGGVHYIWLLVDPFANQEPQRFLSVHDGEDFDANLYSVYLGTMDCYDGMLSHHLFTRNYKIKE